MVKKIVFILALLIPTISFADSFTATINRNNIAVGESFNLTLKLENSSAKGKPDLSELQKYFTVAGQRQSSNTSIINGSYSSSVSWNLTLIPKKEGTVTIPSISIETSNGILQSDPITVNIASASSLPSASEDNGLYIISSLSKRSPYKDEPVVYTVQFVTKTDVANVTIGDLRVDGAIVEAYGKPKIYDKVINGRSAKVVEMKYIITPVNSGSITIPSIVIKGDIPVRKVVKNSDTFGMFDNFGGFGMDSLEPFAVASKEATLEVKQASPAVSPWLPATSVKISENKYDTTNFKAGEPFTRTITILAEGVVSSQLQSIEPKIAGDDFKVYGDKPSIEDNIQKGKITSWKTVSYTLIPQKSGELTLPEITIPWWDVNNETVAYARLDGRTINVQQVNQTAASQTTPALAAAAQPQTQAQTTTTPTTAQPDSIAKTNWRNNILFYSLIGGLVVVLLFAFLWVLSLKRKITSLSDSKTNEPSLPKATARTAAKPELNNKEIANIDTAEKLKDFLQYYAYTKWRTSRNASLDEVFKTALVNNPSLKEAEVKKILKTIQDALYADKEIDITSVKDQCYSILKSADKKKTEKAVKKEKLPELNPS